MKPITQELARFALNASASDMPAAVLHEGKRAILNWLACSIAGSQTDSVASAFSVANELSGPRVATVLGRKDKLDISNAALVNGISADVLSFSDTHPATLMHPGGVVGCALLGLAERDHINGADFLHALIVGYDVGCRIGLSIYPWHYNRGWHITGTAGIFGAAAAAGRLLKLNEQQMTWALGIAATQAAGLREMFGSMSKNLHIGRAAQGGLMAALLAQKGYTSSGQSLEAKRGYLNVLGEAPKLDVILSELNQRWEIATNTYKPYPCGVVIHPIIEGCVTLAVQHDIAPAMVEKIALRCNPLVIELCGKQTPRDTLEGKLSVFHSAAASVIARRMGEREYSAEMVNRADVVALRGKIEVTVDPAIREDETDVTIHLNNGKKMHTHIDHVIGSEQRPMSDKDMEAKCHGLVETVLPQERIMPLVDACWNIDKLADVATLTQLAAAS